MRRPLLCLAVALATLVAAPTAIADGPSGPVSVSQGGFGVASHIQPGLHYVTVSDGAGGTLLERFDVAQGGIFGWVRLHGSWGIPAVGYGYLSGQGLSHNGRMLVLGSSGGPTVSPSKFLVVDPRRMRTLRTIVLDGTFAFDAVSPDGSTLYLIQ